MQNDKQKLDIQLKINKLLKDYFDVPEAPFDPETGRIELSSPTYNGEDVAEALDSILKGWPTIGPKVRQAEDRMVLLTSIKNAIMVNSGASANFLALYILTSPYAKPEHRLKPGDEIITPAVTWSTTVGPIIQAGCVPVFADVNLGTYDINAGQIEKNITGKTRALMIVHPMGCPCDMDKIVSICKRHSLILIEDCCESIGAKYKNKHIGASGIFSTFSFYFSHHITSIEGGIIATDDAFYAEALRCMRANGWLREIRDTGLKDKFIAENPQLDTSFMFPFIGFNFKPTDFAAGLVLNQISRLEELIQKRAYIAEKLTKGLNKYSEYLHLPRGHENCRHGWFTYPIVLKEKTAFSKNGLTKFLKEKRIDTRPIIAGNIVMQPFLKDFKFKSGDLPNADLVMKNGFFLGVHHKMGDKQVEYIQNAIGEFFNQK